MTTSTPESPPTSLPWIPWLAYNIVGVPLTLLAMHTARLVDDKARRGMEGRRRLFARLEHERARLNGCVWFHVASAGEYEQARPILRALRERTGGRVPTLLTVFSPSGHARATEQPETDVTEYLPLDSFPAMERMLSWLQPSALVFVKYDCWPDLVWSARRRGVPTLLLGASLHPRSRRLQPVARWFSSAIYQRLDAIGTIAERDARAFRDQLDVDQRRLHVLGDTRIDQVLHRVRRAEDAPLPHTLRAAGWPYLVFGSIWPADEQVVLAPTLDALLHHAELGAILVPHEPTPEHLQRLEAAVQARGLSCARLSELVDLRRGTARDGSVEPGDPRWRVVLVDTVGVLAEIYRAGIGAYVGGAFSTGVHSVVEPAACGLPVMFGPRHANAVEAAQLVEIGAAWSVNDRDDVRRVLERWTVDPLARRECGERAERFVRERSGATERSLALLWELLPSRIRDQAST